MVEYQYLFLYASIHLAVAHCKTKYQITKFLQIKNTYSYDCLHNVMYIHMHTFLRNSTKGRLYYGQYFLSVEKIIYTCVCVFV